MTTKLNPQPGDIVHVRAKVTEFGDVFPYGGSLRDSPIFRIDGKNLGALEILCIEPRPLKVGDNINVPEPSWLGRGKIIAIHGSKAWCYFSNGDLVLELASLTKAQDPES